MAAVNLRILCVDDEPGVTEALKRQLRKRYEVATANDGPAGLEMLRQQGPFAVVVADHNMPEMDGAAFLKEVCRLAPETVRVMLTGAARLEVAVAALPGGRISRFLTKPWECDALLKTLDACVAEYHDAVRRKHLDMVCEEAQQDFIRAARLDKLMNIYNRATFDDYHLDLHGRMTAHGSRYLLLLADVDHFKNYNDNYGHSAGDQALHAVAMAMRGSLREGDFIARYGGEEIVVLCEGVDLPCALAVGDRLRSAVWNLDIPHGFNGGLGRVSISVGGSMSSVRTAETATEVLVRGDGALYEAKRTGRNKAVIVD
jgi:diguanylate cyclase (GGDEF)-like protein